MASRPGSINWSAIQTSNSEDYIRLLDRNLESPNLEINGDASQQILSIQKKSLYGIVSSPILRLPTYVMKWITGPRKPRSFVIKSWTEGFEIMPIWVTKALPSFVLAHHWIMVFLFNAVFMAVVLVLSETHCKVDSFGTPVRLSCIDSLWKSAQECGIDGFSCQPFDTDAFAFRCPANCDTVKVLEPYTFGNTTINYQTLIIGGGRMENWSNVYRGDSFICPAAIHANLFHGRSGGAGIVRLLGQKSGFTGTRSNGLQGLPFLSSFPKSFAFDREFEQDKNCLDPRWLLMGVSISSTVVLSILKTSPSQFFSLVFMLGYFCVALAADAPEPSNYNTVVSLAFRGFLPAGFVGYTIYRFIVRITLDNLDGTLERLLLWLGPFWIGALDNMTLELLPLQRLTPHDLLQPGAISVLTAILLVILAAAAGQIWAFRIEGRLPRYLTFYGCLATILILLVLVPNLNLRLHHYVVALLLLPGTAVQTRPSLVYQGLLVGLFVNGIARWGFDSILQTSSDLFATPLDARLPHIQSPDINGDIITFPWPNLTMSYDGISVLVNDVERYRGFKNHDAEPFTWNRNGSGQDLYFRLGYIRHSHIMGPSVEAYSDPGTWFANGSWSYADSKQPL